MMESTSKPTTSSHSFAHQGRITFPCRLHLLLSKASSLEFQDIVSWNSAGTKVIIHKEQQFVNHILPTIFSQSSLSSFKRQLSAYGFKREKSKANVHIYSHPVFQRDNTSAINQMTRKYPKSVLSKRGKLGKESQPKVASSNQKLNYDSKFFHPKDFAITSASPDFELSQKNVILKKSHKEDERRLIQESILREAPSFSTMRCSDAVLDELVDIVFDGNLPMKTDHEDSCLDMIWDDCSSLGDEEEDTNLDMIWNKNSLFDDVNLEMRKQVSVNSFFSLAL